VQRYPSQISVVIATLNEEKGIGPTLSEFQSVLTDSYFVVVDGNSFDRTIEIAKNMGADVLLQNGKGKGDALHQGIRQLNSNVRYVVFTDADFTYPAEYVPKMIEILEHNSGVGMVIGNRFDGANNHEKSYTNPFYLGNRVIAHAQHLLNGVKLADPLSGLRVIRADLLKNWKPKSTGFDIEAEMNFLVERSGYRITEIPIDYRRRLGVKKLRFWHAFGILKRIVTESLHIMLSE
jgi:glycosyltransferase involved in cell wall biosynthesis